MAESAEDKDEWLSGFSRMRIMPQPRALWKEIYSLKGAHLWRLTQAGKAVGRLGKVLSRHPVPGLFIDGWKTLGEPFILRNNQLGRGRDLLLASSPSSRQSAAQLRFPHHLSRPFSLHDRLNLDEWAFRCFRHPKVYETAFRLGQHL